MSHIFRTLTLTAISDGSRRRRKSILSSLMSGSAPRQRARASISSLTRRDAIPRSAHALRRNPRPRTTPLVSSHFLPPHRTRLMGNVASQHYDGASPDEHFPAFSREKKYLAASRNFAIASAVESNPPRRLRRVLPDARRRNTFDVRSNRSFARVSGLDAPARRAAPRIPVLSFSDAFC